MKATGIVRRIDDLGRVVIPKEIRRTLRIRVSDPLEIYTDKEGEIILKKYSPMGEFGGILEELCESIYKSSKLCCAICDRDWVVAAAGPCGETIVEKPITNEMKEMMESRKRFCHEKGQPLLPLISDLEGTVSLAYPILTEGDVTGAIVFLEQENHAAIAGENDRLLNTVALFLSGHMET